MFHSDRRGPAFALDVPYQFIQAIRVAHAIMESSWEVHVPEVEGPKFDYLRRFFDFDYRVGTTGLFVLPEVEVVHRARNPVTRVGEIRRPLIFPHSVVRRYRTLWSRRRGMRFSFCGLVTEPRKEVLEGWIGRNEGRVRLASTRVQRVLARSLSWYQPVRRDRRLGLKVWSTRRGRNWPGKVWDEPYCRILCGTRFSLCPNGNFVWTYRFFESILCGAIPVVEEPCEVYEGFTYHTMADSASELTWTPEVAQRNYDLAVERLTVAPERMQEELAGLLARQGTR